MGHVVHHAIVVTTYKREYADEARSFAEETLGMSVSDAIISAVNSDWSFLVGPDGSKSGWSDSDDGDVKRARFRNYLRSKRYGDGSSPYQWCEVSYSSDDDTAKLVDHEWKDSPTGAREG